MSIFDRLLGKGKYDPARAAQPYLDKIPGQLHESYDPYIQRGEDVYGPMSETMGQMAQDPVAFLESLMQGYQPSAGYQRRQQNVMDAAANTAAAGGMRGSIQDQTQSSALADSLMSDDMQQYIQNLLGIQGAGLGGQQNIYGMGYDASSKLGSDMANLLGTQGQLAFQGQSQRNRAFGDILGGLTGLAGAGLGAYGMMKMGLNPLTQNLLKTSLGQQPLTNPMSIYEGARGFGGAL